MKETEEIREKKLKGIMEELRKENNIDKNASKSLSMFHGSLAILALIALAVVIALFVNHVFDKATWFFAVLLFITGFAALEEISQKCIEDDRRKGVVK